MTLTDKIIREAVEEFDEKFDKIIPYYITIGEDIKDFIEEKIIQTTKKTRINLAKELLKIVNDGISSCKDDVKNYNLVGKELHYVYGKSQALKIIKLNLENIKHENDTSNTE